MARNWERGRRAGLPLKWGGGPRTALKTHTMPVQHSTSARMRLRGLVPPEPQHIAPQSCSPLCWGLLPSAGAAPTAGSWRRKQDPGANGPAKPSPHWSRGDGVKP